MNNYIFPAIFHYNEDDGSYTIIFPDLNGCISEGKNLSNAIFMANDVLQQHLEVMEEMKQDIPKPSKISDIKVNENEFVNLVQATLKNDKAVRRTISLPQWMDEQANKEGISLSKVLQDALSKKFA
ncbi:MAG: type II toxin-antitoxin system HicB family antitoxin [Clostridiales bacterium]|nr:type II toxin-antitoxin system HicB family antitoxin [Clostridiales bacterium]MBS5878189.1 type II toxin-antitoxin system HicB family antitoxin [Clostridiales bacterium]MDU0939341.1 type II toxin-antitoxin system HicB family antitoxin [Clostridiales bacterium]MDU1042325.1 type II toxin-antitoxin system HicB family antitoxin [Clostridiales bacterium]MDU3490751.1 type II toxin-antitoxin system HicB family antitoxin [Clostridiales bacterium]